MKAKEKKTILSHLKKDDKEFRGQIKDDMELKAKLLGKKKKKKSKEAMHEKKEGKRYERMEDKKEKKKERK